MAVDDIYFRLRLPDEMREEIRGIATQNRRSMTAQIVHIIDEWLADYHENAGMAAHAAEVTAMPSKKIQANPPATHQAGSDDTGHEASIFGPSGADEFKAAIKKILQEEGLIPKSKGARKAPAKK